MRLVAGLVGGIVFGFAAYVIAISMFAVILLALDIHVISQFAFLVAVHVCMLIALLPARAGWAIFRRGAILRTFEVTPARVAAAGAQLHDWMIGSVLPDNARPIAVRPTLGVLSAGRMRSPGR